MSKLAERSFRAAALDLAKMSPDSYRGVAREQSLERIHKEPRLIGESVMVDGQLQRIGETEWLIGTSDRRPSVRVIPAMEEKTNVELARYARVWGIVEEPGVVRGLLVSVPEPKYLIKYELAAPRIVKGANKEKFTVTGELRNTGKQLIKEARIEVRVYQPETDRDETVIKSIKDLAVMQSAPLVATFDPADVQQSNNLTPVRAEVNVAAIEW
jgi:hypothetical protein